MDIVFMGTPQFAVPVLDALSAMDVSIVAVYTKPDKPQGRGLRVEVSPVKQWAVDHGVMVRQPPSFRQEAAVSELASLQPDVAVVAAYGRILPGQVLAIPPRGFVNIHPSMLPRYRGPSPVVTALLDGVESTGVSLMLLDEGMDTGPILAQREEPVLPHDTAESLTARLFLRGAELLRETLPPWLRGEVSPVPQDHSKATVTRMVQREDGEADWNLPAVELERRVRAYTPWPGLYTQWKGKQIKILDAIEASGNGEPGLVVPLEGTETPCGVATGRGVLGIKRLLLEGKRPVPAAEFVQGYRDFVGSRVPS